MTKTLYYKQWECAYPYRWLRVAALYAVSVLPILILAFMFLFTCCIRYHRESSIITWVGFSILIILSIIVAYIMQDGEFTPPNKRFKKIIVGKVKDKTSNKQFNSVICTTDGKIIHSGESTYFKIDIGKTYIFHVDKEMNLGKFKLIEDTNTESN
jgi:hypothetical protein